MLGDLEWPGAGRGPMVRGGFGHSYTHPELSNTTQFYACAMSAQSIISVGLKISHDINFSCFGRSKPSLAQKNIFSKM